MKYQVLDNGKPADYQNYKICDKSWNKSSFNSLREAEIYFDNWFYPYCHSKQITPNVPYEYAEGCFAEIRTVE